jgi:hypothetical protein
MTLKLRANVRKAVLVALQNRITREVMLTWQKLGLMTLPGWMRSFKTGPYAAQGLDRV